MIEFQPFPKVPRLNREVVMTEKIDGTNASIYINLGGSEPVFLAASRKRWITPEQDNHGFARWAHEHKDELIAGLGHGHHFGEWWGSGIQCGYGLAKGEKRFSLFNVERWSDPAVRPACCHVVPVLYRGPFDMGAMTFVFERLKFEGSVASPGWVKPEGVMIYHTAARHLFKWTFENDAAGKGQD